MIDKFREHPFVFMIVLWIVLIIIFLAIFPYIAPTQDYTARTVSEKKKPELSTQVFAEGARRSDNIVRFDDLSSRQQYVLRKFRHEKYQNNLSYNKTLFRGFEYVTTNSTLLEVTTVSNDGHSKLRVTELPPSKALSIFSVSFYSFDNYSYFYAPESEQHIIRSAIENGRYSSPIVVNVNHTVVSYRDSYYILNDEDTAAHQ